MNTASLTPGDLILCNVRGQKFEAIYHGPVDKRRHYIAPVSKNIGWRSVTARQIERKLERQERRGVRAQ